MAYEKLAGSTLPLILALALFSLATVRPGAEPLATYGYSAREADASGLAYYRARYYDAALGRYTQRDPIALGGGINDYYAVGGNPANAVDPSGLAPPSELGPKVQSMLEQAGNYPLFDLGRGVVAQAFGLDVARFLFGLPDVRPSPGYALAEVRLAGVVDPDGLLVKGAWGSTRVGERPWMLLSQGAVYAPGKTPRAFGVIPMTRIPNNAAYVGRSNVLLPENAAQLMEHNLWDVLGSVLNGSEGILGATARSSANIREYMNGMAGRGPGQSVPNSSHIPLNEILGAPGLSISLRNGIYLIEPTGQVSLQQIFGVIENNGGGSLLCLSCNRILPWASPH